MDNIKKIRIFSVFIPEKSIERVVKVMRSGYIGEGAVVKEFEAMLKDVARVPYPVALNSATSALHLALVMAGVRAGDEVITTAQTMMATSHAILSQQARPVFADVQYLTGNLDPGDIEHRITDKTKAILAVHWAGYPCDMDEIHAIARKHSLPVIEDAAHAIGASYRGKQIGAISSYTCFSFQAIKHITCGDGGALCLLNETDFMEAKRRRWYGIDREKRKSSPLGEPYWNVTESGYKYHMNDIAAAIGVEGLRYLRDVLDKRARIANYYRGELLKVPGVTLFKNESDRISANWLFTMHVEDRNKFIEMMKDKGIESSVVHLRIDENDIFEGPRRDLPSLEKFTNTHVSIPLHMDLTDDDVSHIIKSIKKGW